MNQLENAADQLRTVVSEVEERIHLQPAAKVAEASSSIVLPRLPQSDLSWESADDDDGAARPSGPSINEISLSVAPLLLRASLAQLALSLKMRAARARHVLISKHKAVVPEERISKPDTSKEIRERLTAFRDAVGATVRRAVEPNGIVSRPAETLISSLIALEPGRDKRRKVFEKSLVAKEMLRIVPLALT